MQSSTTAFKTALKKAYSVSSTPAVNIEWNLNRFGILDELSNNGTVVKTGTGDSEVTFDEDDEVFPLSSIIDARRPTKPGIVKGWTSPGSLGREGRAVKNTAIPSTKRVYTASADAKYKYWISPKASADTGSPGVYALTNCVPSATYHYMLRGNKLVVQFENSWASPVDVIVQYLNAAGTWVNAGGTYTPGSNGRIELYLQDDGTWSTTKNLKNVTQIKGLRARVTKMNLPRVHAHIIEMAVMREVEVTDKTISFDFDYKASEASLVAPLGRAESATGSLELSNGDGTFDNDRPANDLYGLMNSPAKVTAVATTTAGGQLNTNPLGTMYVDTWGEQSEDVRQLSLSDASMFLKQEYPADFFIDWVTPTEIIWRLLDSVGFSDYVVDESPEGDLKAKYYWTDPEKTVWDHIKEISEAMQIAVFFDQSGTLRIRARERMYEKDKSTPDWYFDGQPVTTAKANAQGRPGDAGKLTDIVSMTKPHELYANKVTVEYTDTAVSEINKFQPKMEQVWSPEGTVALRTANLASPMDATQTYGLFADSNFATWPYEGYVQIDGEIVKWTAKRYRYYNANGVIETKYIKSDGDKEALDNLNDRKSHMNKFDGGLRFESHKVGGVTKRKASMSTVARSHKTGHEFSMIRTRHKNGTVLQKDWYTRHDPKNSVFKIQTTTSFGGTSFTVARRGQSTTEPPRYLGTSLKFDKTNAYKQGSAGVWFGGETYDSGYYVELALTSWAGKNRSFTNEVSLYVRLANGKLKRIGKGVTRGIAKGQWYDLDIYQRKEGLNLRITIMVNGVTAMTKEISQHDVLQTDISGLYGVFARGSTHVEFEYLYAANSAEVVPFEDDDASRWDLITGGYRSNYYNKYLYKANISERLTKWSANRRTRNAGFAFDEFGAKAHELREFSVKFEPAPVLHSRLYLSNEWYSDCLEYTADHNSAKFLVAGKGRDNVIINGEDTLLYGSDNPVEQKMFVYGRVVKAEDTQKYEVSNKKSLRRTGEVEITISSPWIQSESAAKKIGDWIDGHWSNGSEVLEMEVFGNPLLQIGDVAGVFYERKSMTPDKHQYYITGVSHSYKEGLTTSVSLQRRSHLIT